MVVTEIIFRNNPKSHRLFVEESMAMLTSQLDHEKYIRVRCKDLQTHGLMCPTEAVLHTALLIDVLLPNDLQCHTSFGNMSFLNKILASTLAIEAKKMKLPKQ